MLSNNITNPVNGDTMLVLESTTDTNGTRLRFQFTLPPHAEGTPLHYHSTLAETFTVVEGTLAMCVGGKKEKRVLIPGEAAEVPVGMAHRFWNPSDQPVTFFSEVTPAGRFERFIRSMYGLAIDGKTDKKGMPKNPLHLIVALQAADFYFAGVPHGLQKALFTVLGGIARRTGADRDLDRYYPGTTVD